MSTSADRLRRRLQAQAKVAAAAARKRKAEQLELDRSNYIKQFDKTAAALAARRKRDEATKNMIIRGDPSWRKGKKGQAIAGSEDGLYPKDAIVNPRFYGGLGFLLEV